MTTLATRHFTPSDQMRFAAIAADWNPLHVDELGARRLLFGRCAVHGVHGAMWAVEKRLAADSPPVLARVTATFRQPLFVAEQVSARLDRETASKTRITLLAGGVECSKLQCFWEPSTELDDVSLPLPNGSREPTRPRTLTYEEASTASGSFRVTGDVGELRELFPELVNQWGARRVAAFAALSRVVGMECPGERSLFSVMSVRAVPGSGESELHYNVESADERFSLVTINVSGCGIEASLEAFVRPAPVAQPSYADIATQAGSFGTTRALVVGGSRGLGEVTAKILAAGGADVLLTYAHGKDDAERVVREITDGGGSCDCVQLDVTEPNAGFAAIRAREFLPTQLYFFATPRIFVRRQGLFSPEIFARFVRFYVQAFADVYEKCLEITPDFTASYPSTVAVSDPLPALVEYATAKAAGESLCEHLTVANPRGRIVIDRLPRVLTDQTAVVGIVPEAADPIVVATGIVRGMHSSPSASDTSGV